ncbi:hypothetical protein OH77DRAFT_1428435 [Trametes cingulata]|nr:hypothetical protein OH77DRAFT_1428435 [Trametes cingulata]
MIVVYTLSVSLSQAASPDLERFMTGGEVREKWRIADRDGEMRSCEKAGRSYAMFVVMGPVLQ